MRSWGGVGRWLVSEQTGSCHLPIEVWEVVLYPVRVAAKLCVRAPTDNFILRICLELPPPNQTPILFFSLKWCCILLFSLHLWAISTLCWRIATSTLKRRNYLYWACSFFFFGTEDDSSSLLLPRPPLPLLPWCGVALLGSSWLVESAVPIRQMIVSCRPEWDTVRWKQWTWLSFYIILFGLFDLF